MSKAVRGTREWLHGLGWKPGDAPGGVIATGRAASDLGAYLAHLDKALPQIPDWSTDGISITLPHPPKSLQPNARVHWTDKHRATAAYRALARAEARVACGATPPKWQRAVVAIEWSAVGVRHPDPDNIVGSLKAAFDGLQDAGVVENDSGLWPERPVILTKQPWAGVRLTVRQQEPAKEVVPK